jgi:hypothetical protein
MQDWETLGMVVLRARSLLPERLAMSLRTGMSLRTSWRSLLRQTDAGQSRLDQ